MGGKWSKKFLNQGSGYSLRGARGILYWSYPIQIPSKCWGWSTLVLMHWPQRKKPQLLTKYGFWKNQERPSKIPIFAKTAKNEIFLKIFLNFLRHHILLGTEDFCVAFSASRRFFWAIKNCFWTIFQFFHPKNLNLIFAMLKYFIIILLLF